MGDVKKKVNLGSKPPIEVRLALDISDPENPKVITDLEAEKMEKPEENVFWIVSKWVKPSFNLSHIIEMNQYLDKIVQGQIQRVFDANALMTARIRVLLKEWNLDELDEKYKLKFDKSIDNPKVQIISPECMAMIGEIEPSAIIYVLYNTFMAILHPNLYGDTAIKNLMSEEEKKA